MTSSILIGLKMMLNRNLIAIRPMMIRSAREGLLVVVVVVVASAGVDVSSFSGASGASQHICHQTTNPSSLHRRHSYYSRVTIFV